jgi:hypothetical protein
MLRGCTTAQAAESQYVDLLMKAPRRQITLRVHRQSLSGFGPMHSLMPQVLTLSLIRIISVTDIIFFIAASVLGYIWADPNNPRVDQGIWFPEGSIVVKTIFSTATDEELPTMKGSPTWDAVSDNSM